MADTYRMLSLEEVQTLTDVLERDIITSPVLLNADIFAELGIKVLTGVEYRNSIMVYNRKGGTARAYKAGNRINSSLGYMEERKLEVHLSWNRYPDNIQNYREKEPFSVLGTNGTYQAPNSEFAIREIGKAYSEDVMSNQFFGNRALGDDNALGLYDGFHTLIDKEINGGKIAEGNYNFKQIDPIVEQSPGDEAENFRIFQDFYNAWHPRLKAAPLVLVLCSPETKMLVVDGYLQKYTGMQSPDAATDSFRFLGMPNVKLVANPIVGKGGRMIATVPGNLEFGCDTLNDWSKVFVQQNYDDANELVYQVQSAQGCRIRQITGDKLCVSSGTNTPLDALNGDYQNDSINLVYNDVDFTSVTKSPDKKNYDAGETVTITATPAAGKKFKKWSDNSTINPRTIVTEGFPITLEAIGEDDTSAGG